LLFFALALPLSVFFFFLAQTTLLKKNKQQNFR